MLVADFEDTATGLNHPVSGVTPVTSNVWHHAAATYDTTSDTWRLYLDGALDRTLALGSDFTPESTSIQHAALGTSLTSTGAVANTGGYFAGVLDEARIWNVARSQAQIQATKDHSLTSGTGLIARYGLDEGAGTATASSIGGAPAGTLINAPLWTAGPPLTPLSNNAPVFTTNITNQTNAEGDVVSLDANATDADGDTLFYSCSTGLPNGLAIDSSTGVISGTLSSTSAGNYNTILTVSDGTDNASDPFTWTIANTNAAPIFSTDITDRSSAEGDVVSLAPAATDADGDTLAYSALGLPGGISINPTTGAISGTLNATSSGVHNVVITVSDGSDTDTDPFIWTVANTNQPPIFSADLPDRTDGEGDIVSIDASATDGDGDTLSYSALGLPSGIAINAITGAITGTLSTTSSGVHNITVTVSDGVDTDTDTFTWTVSNANQPPVFTTDLGDRTDAEGAVVNLQATATDPDGDTLIYEASGLPAGISINGATGAITGTIDFSAAAGSPHAVTVTVRDGTSVDDTDTFSWTVTNTNQAPVFSTDLLDQGAAEGGSVSLDADATDGDGDTLTYSASGLPGGLSIDSATGIISGTLAFGTAGIRPITVTVSDGLLTDTDGFTLTVSATSTALLFDGTNDYVTMGAAPGLGAATFTLEAWIRRDGAGVATSTGNGGVTAVPIVTKGRAEADGSNLDANYFMGIDGSDHLVADFEDTATGLNHPVIGAIAIPVSATTWHHVAATYDGTTWHLYVDGVADTTLSVGNFTPRADSIQHAGIGTAMTSAGLAAGFFAGAIDEARIWSVARSTAEIQATRTIAITGPRNKLLARYGFDEAAGSAVGDAANGINGIATNGPTWVAGTALSAAGPNVAPAFSTNFTNQSAAEGDPVNLDADASDANADSLTYSASGLPSGLSINATTGVVSGTLAFPSAGTYPIILTVSDSFSTDTDSFTLTVTPGDAPPAAPSGLIATRGNASVSLVWSANGEVDLAGYRIFRGTSAPVSTTGNGLNGASLVSGTTYLDGTASNGTTYFYVVVAVDTGGHRSVASATVSATPSAGAGTGLQFNGTTQRVTFGAAPALGVTSFTLETWFKRTGAGVGASTGTGGITLAIPLITKGGAEAETPANVNMNYFLGIDASSAKLVADFEEPAGPNHPVTGTAVVTSNVWHHVAATYDATTGTWKLYLDGLLDTTLVLASAFQPQAASIEHAALGTSLTSTGTLANGGIGGFFLGVLDEVRIWNVVRSATQISASRDLELTSGTGLIARYGLNEGAGTTAASSVAGAPTGTLVNTPTWVAGFTLPDSVPPAAPTGLATAPGNNLVTVSWSANAESDLAGYRIFRGSSAPVSTSGNGLNGVSLLTSPTYTDNTALNGTTYYYAVIAVDSTVNLSGSSASVSATPSAAAGSALRFDGTNDHVTFGPAVPGLGVTDFTIETWFRRDGAGVATSTGNLGLANAIPLVTKGRAELETPANLNMNYFLGIDATSGVLVADFEEAAGGTTLGLNHPVTGITAIAISATTWHHAAATYDTATDTWRLYLDGNLERTLVLTGNPTPESTSIQHAALGTAMDSTGAAAGFFNGVLDEVRIWNVARSQAQIQASQGPGADLGHRAHRPLRHGRGGGHRRGQLDRRRRQRLDGQRSPLGGRRSHRAAPGQHGTRRRYRHGESLEPDHQPNPHRRLHGPRSRGRRNHARLPMDEEWHRHRWRDRLDAQPRHGRQRRPRRPHPGAHHGLRWRPHEHATYIGREHGGRHGAGLQHGPDRPDGRRRRRADRA